MRPKSNTLLPKAKPKPKKSVETVVVSSSSSLQSTPRRPKPQAKPAAHPKTVNAFH